MNQTSFNFVFLLLLSLFVIETIGNNNNGIPILIKSMMVPAYPYIPDNCYNYGYYLVELNGFPFVRNQGELLFKNDTHILAKLGQNIQINTGMVQHYLNLYNSSNFEDPPFTLDNVGQSECLDSPSPIDFRVNYVPETFNDIPLNSAIFNPTNIPSSINSLGAQFGTSYGPFAVDDNIYGAPGYYSFSFQYNPLAISNTTEAHFYSKNVQGSIAQYTVPTFLENYYPVTGEIVNVKFHPSSGLEKSKNNPIVITFESTGSQVFGGTQLGDSTSIPIYPVSKINGKIQYVSSYTAKILGQNVNISLSIFNKEQPIIFNSTWGPKSDSLPTNSSADSSYYFINQEKGLSILNMVVNDLANAMPFGDIVLYGFNSSYVGDDIGMGNEKVYRYTRSIFSKTQGVVSPFFMLMSRIMFPSIEIPVTNVDKEKPVVKKIEFIPLSSGYVIMRAHITDNLSGFAKLELSVNGGRLTPSNLVSGNLLDGIYEVRTQTFLTNGNAGSIYVEDKAGNAVSTFDFQLSNPFYSLEDRLPSIPGNNIDLTDITTFKFEPNNINVTTFGSLCTLYIGYKGASPERPPSFLMRLTKSEDVGSITDFSQLPVMQWDSSLGLYKYQFFVPPRLFTGNIDYLISVSPFLLTPTTLYQYFGEEALLKVNSEISDEMPPIVTKQSFTPSSLTLGRDESAIVTLTIDIEDPINGLKSGTITIGSDYDSKVGYKYSFTPVDAINKNAYYGTYQFSFKLDGNTRSQNYSIVKMDLVDTSGHISSIDSLSYTRIHPLFQFYDSPVTMTLTCTGAVDNDPPIISSLTLSRTSFGTDSLDREFSVQMTTQDSNGISPRHIPYIVLIDSLSGTFKAPFTIVSSNSTSSNYKLSTKVPHNFGNDDGFVMNVFGIYDNHLNTNGYSTNDLRVAGFPFHVETVLTITPILESYLEILSTGGPLQIYGQKLKGNNVFGLIDYRDGNGYQKFNDLPLKTGIAVTINNVFPIKTSFFVKLSVDGVESNELLVIPIPVKPAESFCKGNPLCGGPERGYCSNEATGCICYPPYFGSDCSNKNALGSNPDIDTSTPNTGNDFSNNDEMAFSYYISITELKEYNINGETVQHYFLKDWTFSNISVTDKKEYKYSTSLSQNNILTHIDVTLRFFDKQEQVIFAGNEYFMSPNSVKYTITMSPYGFGSRLNSLELVMASNFTLNAEDACSIIKTGNSSINAEFVQIKVNDHYLYSRFIKLGEIDSRPQQISNKFINQQTSKSAVSYVGVQIPFYTRSVILDPDFSVLIDTKKTTSDDKDAVCGDKVDTSSSNSPSSPFSQSANLSKVQIAGIIIGSVGFAAVVVAAVTYSIYKNRQMVRIQKQMSAKLNSMN